jgi:hypothetical protein
MVVAVMPGADAVLVVLLLLPPHALAKSAATTSRPPNRADLRPINEPSMSTSWLSGTPTYRTPALRPDTAAGFRR